MRAGFLTPTPWTRQAVSVVGRKRGTYRGKMAVIKAEA